MNATVDTNVPALGQIFLQSLAMQDFNRIEALFAPAVRFRALLPPRIREESTAEAATGWLRYWFGKADTLQVLQSAAAQVFDLLYMRFRLRTHEPEKGWRVIEQQVYCKVHDGHIIDMALLCSGFWPDSEPTMQTAPALFNADGFYDAGAKGCADGPLDDIAGLMRRMNPGQTLEVHASALSVAEDVPAWCRMAGHELVEHEGENYLIRRK
jgi:TusA-related sulfurtransferase